MKSPLSLLFPRLKLILSSFSPLSCSLSHFLFQLCLHCFLSLLIHRSHFFHVESTLSPSLLAFRLGNLLEVFPNSLSRPTESQPITSVTIHLHCSTSALLGKLLIPKFPQGFSFGREVVVLKEETS